MDNTETNTLTEKWEELKDKIVDGRLAKTFGMQPFNVVFESENGDFDFDLEEVK